MNIEIFYRNFFKPLDNEQKFFYNKFIQKDVRVIKGGCKYEKNS